MVGGSATSEAANCLSQYLERMKRDSSGLGLVLGGRRVVAGMRASQYLLPFTLPMARQNSTWRGSHVSRLHERTCDHEQHAEHE